MKFGVREICDVVLRAKANGQKVGNETFQKDEPVIYFDSAKTSTVEGAATTVYAQGGKGNSRLIAWEGERTVTFTMEDALMSPMGFAILSGAGLVDATAEKKIKVHTTSKVEVVAAATTGVIEIDLSTAIKPGASLSDEAAAYGFVLDDSGNIVARLGTGVIDNAEHTITFTDAELAGEKLLVLVDYYVAMSSGVQQIEISPDKFAGNYYLEASTLFRRQEDGVDMPAQFVIPNVKIQSAFTFSMASSGDPSTFTFTMDAFPDYTKFERTNKVLFALQIVEDALA